MQNDFRYSWQERQAKLQRDALLEELIPYLTGISFGVALATLLMELF